MDFAGFKKILAQFGLEYFNKYYGSYRGFVAKNEDPKFLGRVQVSVPSIYGKDILENWAWPKGMFAGKGIGLFAIPNEGDAVWVSFEGGDPRFPIWEYGWFGTGDVPTTAKNNGNKPTNMVYQSTSGHRIELDDKTGAEAVRIYSKHGYGFEINSNGISQVAPTGKHIYLGGLNAAAEPGVLGNKNETALNDVKAVLQQLITLLTTIGAADGLLAGAAGLTYAASMSAAATSLNSAMTALSTAIPATKSVKIKLD